MGKLWEDADFKSLKMNEYCKDIVEALDASAWPTKMFRNWQEIWERKPVGADGDVLLLVTLRSWHAPAKARIGATGPGSRGFAEIALPVSDDYIRYGIPLKCLRNKGADVAKLTRPFVLETEGKADFAIAEVRLGSDAQQVLPCR